MLHDVRRKAVHSVWYAVSVISAALYESFVRDVKYMK